jgi:hypothetical protein
LYLNLEITKDELKRVKALVNERKATFRASLGLTIKAATEKAMQSLTPAERRVIETSTHGKRYVMFSQPKRVDVYADFLAFAIGRANTARSVCLQSDRGYAPLTISL